MELTVPVKKGETIELDILNLGSGGEGAGRLNGFTVFVKGALPGEKVRAEINLVKRNYAAGTLKEILGPSPEREDPPCPVYDCCGGCQLQHLSYRGQLQAKEQKVRDALVRIGHIKADVLPIIGCADPFNYRNKMQFPAAHGAAGKIEIGCYAAETHSVVDTESCMIQEDANNRVLAAVREWMQRFNISAYDENTKKGLVRHIMGRAGIKSGEVMAVIITSAYDIPCRRELIECLKASVPGLKSVVQNINKKPTNVVMGAKDRILWGEPVIKDTLGDLTFNISARSFFQVNSVQAERLYSCALDYADLTGKETVTDIYCGTGTISLYMAKRAAKVYGIELAGPAIEDAKKNAELNGCANAEFIQGDARDVLPDLLKAGIRPDAVLLDPPRAGCDEKVLSAVAGAAPKRIVYISCNPASLARDLAYLAGKGYEILKVQPVDMFPMTVHVETVVLLLRQHVCS